MFGFIAFVNREYNVNFKTTDVIRFIGELRHIIQIWIKLLAKIPTNDKIQIQNLIINLDQLNYMTLFVQERLETKYITIEEGRSEGFELDDIFARMRINSLETMKCLHVVQNYLKENQLI